MSTPETAVREAAVKLHEAILEAQAAGYRVVYPSVLDGLLSISVSETAKVTQAQPAADQSEKPLETFGQPRRPGATDPAS